MSQTSLQGPTRSVLERQKKDAVSITYLVFGGFEHVEPEHNLRHVLPVRKVRVSLVRLSASNIPVTQEAVLAHGAAVSRGGHGEGAVER